MMSFSKNIFRYDNALCLCLVMSSILVTYGWALNFFQLISLILFVVYFIKGHKGFPLGLPKQMYYYLGYYGISMVALWFVYGISNIPVTFVLFFMFLCMYLNDIKGDRFLYWYRKVAYVSIIFYVIQLLVYYTLGISMSGIFFSLPVNIIDDVSYLVESKSQEFRFSSFFSEPSHFAIFLTPLLMLEVLYYNDKKHLLRACVLMFCLLLTQSGSALVGIGTTIVLICYFYVRNNKAARIVKYIPIAVISVGVVGFYFFSSAMGASLIARTSEFQDEAGLLSSGFVRVVRGYIVFGEYNIFEKIFGLNNTDALLQVINQRGLSQLFTYNLDGTPSLFFNSVHYILLETGILGVFLYILFLKSVYNKSSIFSKVIVIQLVAFSFISQMYFNDFMLFYIVLAYILKNATYNSYNLKSTE